MKRKYLVLCFFLFLLVSINLMALDDVDRVFFQTQNEKLIAQVNAKIDSQTLKIENNLKTSVENAKNEIKTEMTEVIKGSLKAIAIGLSGLIIITLAIFKIIDLKIQTNKNIKKYEKELQDKTQEYETYINNLLKDKENLEKIRTELIEYNKKLNEREKNIMKKEKEHNIVNPPSTLNIKFPKLTDIDKDKKETFLFNKITFIISIILIVSIIAYLVYRFVFMR